MEWFREVTHHPDAGVVARAHFPRLLARVAWAALHTRIPRHCGVQVEWCAEHDGVAIAGQVVRGTRASGETHAVVIAGSHPRRPLGAHAPMQGSNASAMPVGRDVCMPAPREAPTVTLDAPHCPPTTTAPMHHAGGQEVLPVQAHPPLFCQPGQPRAATAVSLGSQAACEQGHGRLTTRAGPGVRLHGLPCAPRGSARGVPTLVGVQRPTGPLATQKTTDATAADLSNHALRTAPHPHAMALMGARRQPWHVASDHGRRDVTWHEANVKTTSANHAHVRGCCRSVARCVLRRCTVHHVQEALEDFADCPRRFAALLRQVKFL